MGMRMVVVVMSWVGMLVAFSTACTQRRPSAIKAFAIQSTVFVLHSLGLPAVLRIYPLEPEIVQVRSGRVRILGILRHWASPRGRGATQSASKARKHTTKLALNVRVFSNGQRLCLCALDGLWKRRGSSCSAICIGTESEERLGVVVQLFTHPAWLVIQGSGLVARASRG